MYSKFQITKFNILDNIPDYQHYVSIGQSIFKKNCEEINCLSKYIEQDNMINSDILSEDCFPTVNADIFLSHSHRDESFVKYLAGWLNEKLGLNAFIDSCVWYYANDLLKTVDDSFCKNDLDNSYSYEKRNQTTSHIHILLNCALAKMIDKTEIFLFVKSHNSIFEEEKNIDNGYTLSPWIYSELLLSDIIKINKSKINVALEKKDNLEMNVDFAFKYKVPKNQLIEIYQNDLITLGESGKQGIDAISFLYKLKKII